MQRRVGMDWGLWPREGGKLSTQEPDLRWGQFAELGHDTAIAVRPLCTTNGPSSMHCAAARPPTEYTIHSRFCRTAPRLLHLTMRAYLAAASLHRSTRWRCAATVRGHTVRAQSHAGRGNHTHKERCTILLVARGVSAGNCSMRAPRGIPRGTGHADVWCAASGDSRVTRANTTP